MEVLDPSDLGSFRVIMEIGMTRTVTATVGVTLTIFWRILEKMKGLRF